MKAFGRASLPAFAGGSPVFPDGLPLTRPGRIDADAVATDIREILRGGQWTNGDYVRHLEKDTADYLGVRHCVAVSSCTAGLMLVLRASGVSGDVVLPSFTFAATAHAVVWNGLRPVFADVDRATLTLSPSAVVKAIGMRTSAILATHIYGTPCRVEELEDVARRNGIRLFFDAAHGFGSLHQGAHVGSFGDAEIFSLSPTKVLSAGEGGIISTDDDVLAERCRIGRDYGNPGDYDCRFVGLNARMSEVHAAIALGSLVELEERIELRNNLARTYRRSLSTIEGVSIPDVPEGDRSTYKDLTILVDADGFGMDASTLSAALKAEGIETRRYYSPPVHKMRAYRTLRTSNGGLPVTDWASRSVLSLPLWTGMKDDDVEQVAAAIERINMHAYSSSHTAALELSDDQR